MNWKKRLKNWAIILGSGFLFLLFFGDGSESIIIMLLVWLLIRNGRNLESRY